MPKFYRESTPEDTIFLLKTGSFRKEQACENKSAYHLYQHGKHFYATDESYFLRTKKLASHILDGLNVCAEIFHPISFPVISFSQAAQMIGWSLESKPLVITSHQQGCRKYFVFSEVHEPD